MSEKDLMRETGIPALGSVPWGTHLCQFYNTREDLLDILAPYFKAGLEQNEYCIWITSAPLSAEDAKRSLYSIMPDFEDYLKKGQIEIIPHDQWYLKGGAFDLNRVLSDWLDKLNGALASGYEGLRVTGNTAWLEKKDWQSFTDYEETLEGIIGKYRVIAICTYSLEKCGANEIIEVVKNHEMALIRKKGRWERFESAERRKTRESLADMFELNRAVLNAAPDGIIIYDSPGKCTYANEAAAKITGGTIEKLMRQDFREIDSWRVSGLLEAVQEALSTGVTVQKDAHMTTAFGKEVWLDCRLVPFNSRAGRNLLLMFNDQTDFFRARQQREEALARAEAARTASEIIENMPEPVILTDLRLNIVQANGAAEVLGYAKEELAGKQVSSFFSERTNKDLEEHFKKALQGEVVKNFECAAMTNKGELPLLLDISLLKEVGRPEGFIIAASDITEFKKLEEERKKAQYNLQERVKEMRTLYAVSSLLQACRRIEGPLLEKIISILPAGWQYPEITAVRLRFDGREYRTGNFRETPWAQSVEFNTSDGRNWSLEVAYLEEKPPEAEGPFFAEERILINSIAGMITTCVDRINALDSLEWELAANSAIANLSRALISTKPVEEISSLTLEAAKNFTASPFGFVGYIDEKTGFLFSPTLTKEIWEVCGVEDKRFVFEKFHGLFGWVLTEKKPVLTNEPEKDPRSKGTPPGHIPIKRFLSAPAMLEEKLVGQIALANSERDYTERDLRLVERLASIYAIAVCRQRELDQYAIAKVVIENSPTVLFRYRAEEGFPVEFVSGNVIRYGYTQEELVSNGISLARLRHQDDSERIARLFEENRKNNLDEFELEYRLLAKNGEVFWVEEQVRAVRDADGKIEYYQSVLVDITGIKEAELRIRSEMEITNNLLLIADAAVNTDDVEMLMERTAESVKNILRADACLTYLWEPEARQFNPCAEAGLEGQARPVFKVEQLNIYVPFINKAVTSRATVIEKYSPEDEGGVFTAAGADTLVAIPLFGKTECLGLIMAVFRKGSPAVQFSERDKRLWDGISYQVSTALEKARLYEESLFRAVDLSRKIEMIQTMKEIDKSILSTFDSNEILDTAAMMISRVIRCDSATLSLIDPERKAFIYKAGFGIKSLRKGATVDLKDTSASEVVRTGRLQFTANLLEVKNPLPLEKRFLDEGFLSHVRVPLKVKGSIVGVLTLGSKKPSAFSAEDISIIENLANQIAVALENSRLLTDLEELLVSMVKTLTGAIDAKSPWTMGHSERVTALALKIGKELGLEQREIRELELAGLLHDIGKLGTYEFILDKPDKLTPEEEAIMRQHPGKGADILSNIKQFRNIISAIRHHHEYFDGTGYPDGLKGEEINLYARILTVADTVDAMAADRPYRKGKPMAEIAAELKRCSGSQFDPAIVDISLKVLPEAS